VPDVHTRSLGELRRLDAAAFGGKSANLGELLSLGLHVPTGFAVAASAFRTFVDGTGLDGTIAAAMARAASGDVEDGAAASKAIGEAMRFAPLPDDVRDELAARHDELVRAHGGEPPPVAVRSSAIGEDGEESTFAGQQESFLWLRGLEQAMRDAGPEERRKALGDAQLEARQLAGRQRQLGDQAAGESGRGADARRRHRGEAAGVERTAVARWATVPNGSAGGVLVGLT